MFCFRSIPSPLMTVLLVWTLAGAALVGCNSETSEEPCVDCNDPNADIHIGFQDTGSDDEQSAQDTNEPEDVAPSQDLADGTEEDVVVGPVCSATSCTQAPQNGCAADGVTLTTFTSPGTCSVSNGQIQCEYASTKQDCSASGNVCVAGKCVPASGDPCNPNPCTTPPQAECGEDGLTLLSYALPASCSNLGGEANCEYSISSKDCSDSGMVCQNAECVAPANPCQPNPCTNPPANYCSGNVLKTHPSPGVCTPNGSTFYCDYTPQSTDCAASDMECQGSVCVPVVNPLPTPTAEGDLVITEFMARSQGGTDYGEWVELYNPSNEELDLYGCILRDAGSDSHTFASSVPVAAGGFVLLARNGDSSLNHGLAPDYVYAGFQLSNTEDEIMLECGGVVIDQVAYTSAWVKEAVSTQLSIEHYESGENDLLDNWCFGTSSYGTDSMLGTPGLPNTSCTQATDPCTPNPCTVQGAASCDADGVTLLEPQVPGTCTANGTQASCSYAVKSTDCSASGKVCSQAQCVTGSTSQTPSVAGQLVISEFMARSMSGSGDTGEYIELYNASSLTLDLKDCLLKDASSTHTIASQLLVAPGDYLLLAYNGDSAANFGLTPDYVYDVIVLGNDSDTIKIQCGTTVIDQITYASGWVTLAASTQLNPTLMTAADNDLLASWCTSTATYGSAGKLGTPGAANSSCP